MDKRNSWATLDFGLVIVDIMTILAAYCVTVGLLRMTWLRDLPFADYIWMLLIFSVVFVLFMMFLRMYNVTTFNYVDRVVIRTLGSIIFSGVVVSSLVFMLQMKETSRLFLLVFCAASAMFVLLRRVMTLKRFKGGKSGVLRAVFIGEREIYEEYLNFLSKTSMKYNIVGLFTVEDEEPLCPGAFENYIIDNKIHEVIMVYSANIEYEYKQYLQICEDMGITVRLVLDMVKTPTTKRFIHSVGTFPVLTYHNVSMNRAQLLMKLGFDYTASMFGLILLSPIMLITALAIKIDSPGPVFFKQERVGRNGDLFNIIKFRSMCTDAERLQKELDKQNKIKDGMMFKMDDDPRVTKVGRFIRKYSIDELPQLFNVLRREMSLVGTRPPTVSEVEKYERKHRRRISINPGITGMWQVSGRSDILDFETVVELDTQYIDQWTFMLDMKLLMKTVVTVISRKGAY